MTLVSPGVLTTIQDESFYNSAGQGTIPLIIIATAANKASPTSGGGIAPSTIPSQAGKLFLATSQRDLIQNFGNPLFYTQGGTPLHGYELNEYGLWAAYSYLGISNQCYVLRADLDLAALKPSTSAPTSPPAAGTYWFDLASTSWGVFRANGSATPGSAWTKVATKVAFTTDIDNSFVPLSSFGSNGDVAVVPLTASNYLFEKVGGTWYQIGTTGWKATHPTVVTGSATTATLVQNDALSINGTTVTFPQSPPHIADVVSEINAATIPNISASSASSGALKITNTAGGAITLANVSGTPLTALGLTAATTPGVSVTRNSNATYPDGSVAGSFWVKGNPANNGAQWSVKFYSSAGIWSAMTAPFYVFDSTLLDGNTSKDAAAIAAMPNPTIGNVYVGFDTTTGDQQIRRWSGTRWESLVYEADFVAPASDPLDGTLWYNTNFTADIMVGNGENWLGYRHHFPSTDPHGPQIGASAPIAQSDGTTPLVDNDLWIDTSDLEDYPVIRRFDVASQTWRLIDNTDQTTPFGVVFADARSDSGPTFTGIANSGSYSYNSTVPADMALSDYVEPDAPDARLYPAGTLLFNTRYSTYNVKKWQSVWWNAGGFDANTDFTVSTYTVGAPNYTFPALTSPGTWVNASGNQVNGSPYMGRKAQRAVIVRAMAAQIASNQDIRSEVVFFNLMAAPGYPELMPDFITLNADMKEVAFCLADTPIRLKPEGSAIQAWANNTANVAADGEDGLVTGDINTAVYYPWGLGTNVDGSEIVVPPSAIALATVAYNDQVAYPWYAPAGFNRGLVTNASSVGYLSSEGEYVPTILNNGQRDVLYTNRINPIAYIPNRGLVVYGQKTLSPVASALDRVNVARLVNYIIYHLDNLMKPFLFEQNTSTTRATAKATVERFFNSLVGLNGIYDFAVVCDKSNNTPDRIDRNELWVDAAISPAKAVEFIYIPVRILSTSGNVQ